MDEETFVVNQYVGKHEAYDPEKGILRTHTRSGAHRNGRGCHQELLIVVQTKLMERNNVREVKRKPETGKHSRGAAPITVTWNRA
jgi:hypothetical protein